MARVYQISYTAAMLNPFDIPLSLYIHTPWCVKKCPYCDFNSHQVRKDIPEAEYLQALLNDFDTKFHYIQDRPLISIFIGGGTPSLLSPEFYEKLFAALKTRAAFVDDIEITLEANPGTVEQQRFAGFIAAGINRLSLGIQSFDEDQLKKLGRIHDGSSARNAIAAAKAAGFTNFNCDLMHGLPNQSIEEALLDIQTAIDFAPPHLSWYQLTLEPNTLFHRFPPTLPEDDLIFEMQQQGKALLAKNGYDQYEISAYSQNKMCRHNLNYWVFGDYLGIGAGAHSKLTYQNRIERLWNLKQPQAYLNSTDYLQGKNTIETAQLPLEFMMNALRLNQAISIKLMTERTSLTFDDIQKICAPAVAENLIELNKQTIKTTEKGQLFLNELLEYFLP